MRTCRTVTGFIGSRLRQRVDRTVEIPDRARRVIALVPLARCGIGQATIEWLMVAGLLAGIAVFVGRVVPPALRTLLEGLTWGIRTIAP
jgi:hypothetical protein